MLPTDTSSTAKLNVWTEKHPKLGISPMDHLFNQLDGTFGERWRNRFPSEQALANWRSRWSAAFEEQGITFEEIKRGVSAMATAKHPPQLGDFLAACRPALDFEEAYHEAVRQMHIRHHPQIVDGKPVSRDSWSHPAIFWAAASLGNDLLNLSYHQIRVRWKHALEHAMRKPRGLVPEYVPQLPAPGKATTPPEEARKRCEGLRELLGKSRLVTGKRVTDRNLEEVKRQAAQALAELQAHKEKTQSEG